MKDDIDVIWSDMQQGVDDNCRWAALELDNERHIKTVRLRRSISYLEDAKGQMEEMLEQYEEREEKENDDHN